eukprot:1704302-Rhodomonas_salina.2
MAWYCSRGTSSLSTQAAEYPVTGVRQLVRRLPGPRPVAAGVQDPETLTCSVPARAAPRPGVARGRRGVPVGVSLSLPSLELDVTLVTLTAARNFQKKWTTLEA